MSTHYHDPSPQERGDYWFAVHTWVIQSDLSRNALWAYMGLAMHADRSGHCWPSIATIAKEMRLSPASVSRGIKELEEKGFLRRRARMTANGMRTSTEYRIRLTAPDRLKPSTLSTDHTGAVTYTVDDVAPTEPVEDFDAPLPHGEATGPQEPASLPHPDPSLLHGEAALNRGEAETPPENTSREHLQRTPEEFPSVGGEFCLRGREDDANEVIDAEVIDEQPALLARDGYLEPPGFGVALVVSERPTAEPPSTEVAPRRRKAYPPEFEAFWEAFPRERRAAKAQCATKFAKALRDGTPAEEIIQAAHQYANDPNREPAYTAAPLTWLNQQRWESGPLPPRAANRYSGGDAFRALIGQPTNQPTAQQHLTGVPF